MKISVSSLLTAFVLLFSVFVFVFLFNKNKNHSTFDDRTEPVNGNRNQYVIEQILQYMQYENNRFHPVNVKEVNRDRFLNPNEKLQEEKTINLSEILRGEKVVLYYTLLACNSCISEQFILLNKLKRKIGKDRIVILADYVGDDVRLYLKSNNIDIHIYEFGNKDMGLVQANNVPALLLLTSGDRVVTSFVLDIETKYFADYFYQFVEKKFISEKE
ncbi:MAG: hypothetical protein LBL33_02410 [Tannerella sp.]|jgi:hypothetical protein|nr:hypothetical protein [Tannerella sp.]